MSPYSAYSSKSSAYRVPKPLPSPLGGTRPARSSANQSDAGAAPSAWVDDAPVPHQKSDRKRHGTYGNRPCPSRRFQYSRWDGTQVGFDLDADALLEEMTDDLLYHGDLNAALRRMMQQGFQDREGRDVQGMREMLEKLRERRREQLDRYDLGGVYEDIAEPARRDRRRRSAKASTAASTKRASRATSAARSCSKSSRSSGASSSSSSRPISPGRVSELQQYDWMDDAARQQLRRADGGAEEAAPRLDVQPAAAGHVGDVARAARSA